MSNLVDILRDQEEAIGGVFVAMLHRSDCEAFARVAADGCPAMLKAVVAILADGDPSLAWSWAAGLEGPEERRFHVPFGQVLSGLRCFEQAVAGQLIGLAFEKSDLTVELERLGAAVDLLREAYVEVQGATTAEDAPAWHEFASLADGIPDFICLATLQGKPFYLNRAGRDLVGLAEDAVLDSAGLRDFHPEDAWTLLCDVAFPDVQRNGRWTGASRVYNRNRGEAVPVNTTVFVIRRPASGKAVGLAIIHHADVQPGQRQAREALAEVQARKHAILESSLDPIITIDHTGAITEFNRAAEQVFARPRGEVLGTQPSEILFPPTKIAGYRDRIDRYLEAGEGSMLGKRIEVTAVRADGETFPAEMAMSITHEHHQPVLTFFVRDISQRKRAEEEQQRHAAELERSNAELQQFAYVASHDLQEPLRKIRTFGNRLEVSCLDALDQTGRECVQRMQNAAERMQTLIDGLLQLSRVTTEGQNFTPVDLAEVAREVVSDLEIQIEQAEALVEVGKLPMIQADPVQMRQLFQNLIGNALKFRRQDELPSIKVEGRFIGGLNERSERVPIEEEQCRIVVKDNGIGFDEKYLERIFGVFQRLHTRDVYRGTGIGLAICRKIVDRHGGSITAESTPDVGTQFIVVLPVVHRDQTT